MGHVAGIPLTTAALDRPYRLTRILVQDSERLGYLGSLGLHLGASLMLRKQTPFDGPLTVDVAGDSHAIAYEMAEKLLVLDGS